MAELFWQRSLASLDYPGLVAFIEEANEEGDHLEYKLAKHDGESDKLTFDDSFLETVVGFANSGDGLIIVGVHDNEQKRLNEIPGIRKKKKTGKPMGDPASILRNVCATRITPQVYPETHLVEIPEGEPNAGNQVLVVRVRRGQLPPYAINERRIFVRTGDRDELATVREIENLLQRRGQFAPPTSTSAQKIQRFIFDTTATADQRYAPFAAVSLSPVFPLTDTAIEMTDTTDRAFSQMCADRGFSYSDMLLREPDGVVYQPPRFPNASIDMAAACAYADGSVGMRRGIGGTAERENPDRVYRLYLHWAWRVLRVLLMTAQQWPRSVGGYNGPLLCRVAVGSITNTLGKEPPTSDITTTIGDLVGSYGPNMLSSWSEYIEWDAAVDVDDLLEGLMGRLARQVQFPLYTQFRSAIRAASHIDPLVRKEL